MRHIRTVLLMAISAMSAGCVAPGLYQWGGYEHALYASYKDPTKVENLKQTLEAHIAATEQGKQVVAPGLYAELGTLYLESGDLEKAKTFYGRERDAWPESAVLMTSLIETLERRQQAGTRGAPK